MQVLNKLRVTFKEACDLLSVGRDGLYRIIEMDNSFPRSIKEGINKQSAVYFDYKSLVEWWENKSKEYSI